MKMTKQDKELVREQYAKVWHRRDGSVDEKMVDYCTRKTSGYVVIDGRMVTFDKPSIKTNFWFGEHTYDFDEVVKQAEACSKSEEYFIAENLDAIDWRLEAIADPHCRVYIGRRGYSNQEEGCILASVEFCRYSLDGPRIGDAREMTEDERQQYADFIKGEREKFEKRLRTYLKRYGLSKCYFGTYWADR